MIIRMVSKQDVDAIVEIYNFYINETIITFEQETITIDDMLSRFEKIAADDLPWLVLEDDQGVVIGYAYASKWRERYAYRFSVEVTVYLAQCATGKGYGCQLYQALFSELKIKGVHSVIGGITLPNSASIALHEKFSMEKVAHFSEVGYKFNRWLDVGYWQGNLEDIIVGGQQ